MNILEIDQNILLGLNRALVGKNAFLDNILVFCGVYLVYALPIILLLMWFFIKTKQKATAFAFVSTIFSWFVITKTIVPAIWFRARPDLNLIGAKELLFQRPDYSFPSDHATALFGITFGLYMFGYKKAGNWFLLYSFIIVFCRVVLGIHFPLDIVGGAVSGLVGVTIFKLFEKPLEKYIFTPTISFLKKLRLA